MISRYVWPLKETLRGLVRDRRILLLATLLAAFALSIPLFIFTIFYGLSEPVRHLPTAVEISVFTTADADSKALAETLKAEPGVTAVEVIDKDRVFQTLNEGLGVKRNAKRHNPLPDVVVVTVSERLDAAGIEKLAGTIEHLPNVDMVAYESSWHTRYTAITHAVVTGLAVLGAAVALLVGLVLIAALRMTTLAARDEMRTLYVFGAAPIFAIRPWAWRGAIVMGVASGLSLALTALGIQVLSPAIAAAASLYDTSVMLSLPQASWCAYFVGTCAFAGGLTASFTALETWRSVQ